jgi:hypothetical protein
MAQAPTSPQSVQSSGAVDWRAAVTLMFVTALSASPSDEVLIICDDSLRIYEETFESVGIELGLSFSFVRIPANQQHYLAKRYLAIATWTGFRGQSEMLSAVQQ